jgi:uncharacterized protein YggE
MKIVRIASLVVLLLAAAALAGVGLPDTAQGVAAEETDGGITVNGLGAVRTVPDTAELGFGVITQAATAKAAMAANGPAVRKLVAALRTAGVAADDLQTQQASLDPRYVEDGRRIDGYTASTMVSAKVRSLARAPAIVDAAVAAGANTVNGPMLSRSNAEKLYQDALKAAVADARAKAEILAAASKVTLGAATAIVESGSAPVDAKTEARLASDAAEIEPGTQDVVATVTVTFAIR